MPCGCNTVFMSTSNGQKPTMVAVANALSESVLGQVDMGGIDVGMINGSATKDDDRRIAVQMACPRTAEASCPSDFTRQVSCDLALGIN